VLFRSQQEQEEITLEQRVSDLEEIILASNANIGGPTTAAGMAIAQGWSRLVGPCMLVGTLGYAIGTWLGILVGTILGA